MPWRREAAPVADPAGAVSAPAASGPTQVRPWGQWATLPALQRTVGPMQPTSRPMQFPGDLATRQPLALTGVMAHVVDPLAPSGVVDGDGSLAGQPVQRSADVDLDLVVGPPVVPARGPARGSALTIAPRPATLPTATARVVAEPSTSPGLVGSV